MSDFVESVLPPPPFVLLESFDFKRGYRSFLFKNPIEIIEVNRLDEIQPALLKIETAIQDKNLHAAGFLSYESAPAFDSAMQTQEPSSSVPLLWFGLYEERIPVEAGKIGDTTKDRDKAPSLSWIPSINREKYEQAIRQIQNRITAGDTYQVNFTLRLQAEWEGDPFALYRQLCRSQRAAYCAYIDLGDRQIISVSPELFFDFADGKLTVRPMKGTAPRGRWLEEDEERIQDLRNSSKDQAENLMIVDLLRNDLGRISEPGSVITKRLFEIERYETVLQMTSTISSKLKQSMSLWDLFSALFPCGSITGAPKISTMKIISEQEDSPRGIYTGAIGFLSPGVEGTMSVAIRTLWLDRNQKSVEFGVGGGITHDSTAEGEYEECLTKARFLNEERPEFQLLETLLLENGDYYLLDLHLKRLSESARYFGYSFHEESILRELHRLARNLDRNTKHRVRLLLFQNGEVRGEASVLDPNLTKIDYRVALCLDPVNSQNPFLFHKTTHREVYRKRATSRPDVQDVILQNENGEITESTIANIAVVRGGIWWTPPVECGLLRGLERHQQLVQGSLQERILYPDDLQQAEEIYLMNSVRGAWKATLVKDE